MSYGTGAGAPTGRRWNRGQMALVLACLAAGCLAPPADEPDAEVWTAVEEWRVGDLDGPDALTLTGGVARRGDTLYATQILEAHVKVVGPGGVERVVGREGRGPAEFQRISGIGWVGDSLYVVDDLLGKIVFFDPSGTYLGDRPSRTPPIDDGLHRPSPPEWLTVEGQGVATPSYNAMLLERGGKAARLILRTDWSGAVLDTLAEISIAGSALAVDRGGPRSYRSLSFSDAPLFAVEPGGRWGVILRRRTAKNPEASAMSIRTFGTGATADSLTLPYRPVPIPPAVRDSMVAVIERWVGSGTLVGGMTAAVPGFYPPASAVAVDTDGRIWIRRESEVGAEAASWEVVDLASGDRIFLVLPKSFRFLDAEGTRVWGQVEDEFDVPSLVRYRLERVANE